MAKSSEILSLDEEVELHGVTIRKMPNGQYLKALKLIREIPENFMKELMEGKTDMKLSDMLDTKNIATLIGSLLTVTPSFTIKFLAQILNIKEKVLMEDLSPTETIEIVQKFWEINRLESFFVQMKSIMKGIAAVIGFKKQ